MVSLQVQGIRYLTEKILDGVVLGHVLAPYARGSNIKIIRLGFSQLCRKNTAYPLFLRKCYHAIVIFFYLLFSVPAGLVDHESLPARQVVPARPFFPWPTRQGPDSHHKGFCTQVERLEPSLPCGPGS